MLESSGKLARLLQETRAAPGPAPKWTRQVAMRPPARLLARRVRDQSSREGAGRGGVRNLEVRASELPGPPRERGSAESREATEIWRDDETSRRDPETGRENPRNPRETDTDAKTGETTEEPKKSLRNLKERERSRNRVTKRHSETRKTARKKKKKKGPTSQGHGKRKHALKNRK